MSDQSVKKFEEAYDSGLIYSLSLSSEIRFGDYHKQCAWAAWQAGRAEMTIENARAELAGAHPHRVVSATFQLPER